jgi:hypothetical protein
MFGTRNLFAKSVAVLRQRLKIFVSRIRYRINLRLGISNLGTWINTDYQDIKSYKNQISVKIYVLILISFH